VTEGKPLTKEDVLKLIKEHGGTDGLDLSGRNLEGIDLSDLDLWGINLQGAILIQANLELTKLNLVNLRVSFLKDADLQYAELIGTNLQGADLEDANLQGTDLRGADLSKVSLFGAQISRETKLENVYWGSKYILGEEEDEDFQEATQVYRQLKQWHTEAGMYDIAGRFYYREMEARRKARNWRREPFLKLWSSAMRLLCGYGEGVGFVVAWGVAIVFGLAAAYYFLGTLKPETFANSLYYSTVSFTAVGYGSWAPKPEGWAKGMGAAEAVIGVFMMALFLVTFTRKMTR